MRGRGHGPTAGVRRRLGAAARRSALLGALGVSAGVATLAAAPAALAATNYSWSGADASAPNWSQGDNWSGATGSPSGTIGVLALPELGAPCDSGSSTDACYGSLDDLPSLTVQRLTIDDNSPYLLLPQDASSDTLTINAAPGYNGVFATASTNGSGGPAVIAVPVVLANNQSWEVDGGTSGTGGLAVTQVSGDQSLSLTTLENGAFYTNTLDTGPFSAAGGGAVVAQQLTDGGSTVDAQLPADGSWFTQGTSLFVESPGTTSGPLNISGEGTAQPTFAVGEGESPDATLAVTGAVSFDEWSNLFFDIDNNGTAAGDDFSQLTASGTVSLSDATLYLDQGWDDTNGDCATLTPGESFPVISAGSLSGDITYFDTSGNFDTLSPDETSNPLPIDTTGSGCPSGTPTADATLTYGANAITATVLPSTTTTPAPPALANVSPPKIVGAPVVGTTLSVNPGTWTGSPTFSFQWERCSPKSTAGGGMIYTSSNCVAIPGATRSTYTPTTADAHDDLLVNVTGSSGTDYARASTGIFGPILLRAPSAGGLPTSLIWSALGSIGHPSGGRAVRSLLRHGSFRTSFQAPAAGTLTVVWKTTVTTGRGRHRHHRTVTVASGSMICPVSGSVHLTIHLSRAGRTLLSERHTGVVTTATESFRPSGQHWADIKKRFRL